MLDSGVFYTYDPNILFTFQSTLSEKQHKHCAQQATGGTLFGYHIFWSEAMDRIPSYENQDIFFPGTPPSH